MSMEERSRYERKLNFYRNRFFTDGKLDRFVMKKFNEVAESVRKKGCCIRLNDDTNLLTVIKTI